ncbi:MAG: SET domain-containing protein [Proteobacteria bacterium]|nr:SET domain-containing protein [Pseudomonadota bacterium]MBU4011794.1 SET domain-containing protein [Pseudomonadota bacterium]
MIHPDTELRLINDEIGYGVVATGFIPKGTITWVLDKLDRVFSPSEITEYPTPYQDAVSKYCFRNKSGNYVLCWDSTRFVNHSFNPNCMTTAYDLEISIRDIKAGEQITNDYGCFNIIRSFRPSDEGKRRKIVYPDDLAKYYRLWDKKLLSAFRRIKKVDQPLINLISVDLWSTCCRISSGDEEMLSILNCYYDELNKESTATE